MPMTTAAPAAIHCADDDEPGRCSTPAEGGAWVAWTTDSMLHYLDPGCPIPEVPDWGTVMDRTEGRHGKITIRPEWGSTDWLPFLDGGSRSGALSSWLGN